MTIDESRENEEMSTQVVTVLVAQYRECSAQHMLSYSLTWQVPTVTIAVTGLLVAATFGYDVPDGVRAVVVLLGALFVVAMTIAVERNRLLQLRRRRDLTAIERRLAAAGAQPVVWDVSHMATEQAQERHGRGPRLYQLEFFKFLRGLMYLVVVLLFLLFGLLLADTFGADIIP